MKTAMKTTLPGAIVVATVTVIMAACSAGAVRSQPLPSAATTGGAIGPFATDVALSPAQSPTPLGGDCSSYVTAFDQIPPTVEMVSKLASVAIIGVVEEVGDAQWNTDDGKPPPEKEDQDSDHVMRHMRVSVSKELRGTPPADSFVVYVAGGSIGCDKFWDDDHPLEVKPGEEFAFFLRDVPPLTGTKGLLQAAQMWPVSADGTILTPAEGALTVSQLASKVADTE